MALGIDLTDRQNEQLWQLRLHWSVSVALLSISACLMMPIYTRFLREWHTHHPIVQASVSLLVPDLLLVLNFLPLEVMNLSVDHFASRNYCTASAFLTVSSILASNAGVIFVAFTTWNVIVHGQKQTNWRWLLGSQAVGWALGVGLAAYYYAKDYLGVYLGLYCCTTDKHHLDIVIPVFLTFFFSSTSMAVFYFATFKHIRNVTQQASKLKSKSPAAANRNQLQQTSMETVAVKPVATRPLSLGSPAVQPHASEPNSASATPSRRGSVQLETVENVLGPATVPRAADDSAVLGPAAPQTQSELQQPPHTVRAWSVQASNRQQANETASAAAGRGSGAVTPLNRSITPSAAASPPTPTRGSLMGQGSLALPAAASETPEARRAAMTEKKSSDLAFRMLLRGLGLISVYYLCWFFVSLNAALSLGGFRFENLWPEMVAAWFIKLSPIIDALILLDLMRRAESNRNAAKAIGGVQATRFESTIAPLPERFNKRTVGIARQPSPAQGRTTIVAAVGGRVAGDVTPVHQRHESGSGTVTPPNRGGSSSNLHAHGHSVDPPPRSRGSLRVGQGHSLTGASIELQTVPPAAVVYHARGGGGSLAGSNDFGNVSAPRVDVDAAGADYTGIVRLSSPSALLASAHEPLLPADAISSASAHNNRVLVHPVIVPAASADTRSAYLPAPSPVVEETNMTPMDATPH